MANVAHASLTDPNLHEPKGVAAAAAGEFYIADGAGTGAWTKRLFKLTATCTPSAVSANTTSEQTFTVTGVAVATDAVIGVSKPDHQTGLGIVGWRITADDTVAVTFANVSASPITPNSLTYTFIIYRD